MVDNTRVIKLTLALYKITEGFPEKEPLKYHLREQANLILENYILKQKAGLLQEKKKQVASLCEKTFLSVECLQGFLEVVKKQAWANQDYLGVISQEYNNLLNFFKVESAPLKKEEARNKPSKNEKVRFVAPNHEALKDKVRCLKIVGILKEKKAVQIKDLKESFPNITKRTLRRDFEFLAKEGIVKRVGDKNETEYVLR
ncbi:DeoR family transcriptional regulator [Candidatus Parcubacteria bacterium]|nr:DeoR family transcriptional regulator [Candidatus Parcubacteria bacterium]